MKRKDFLKTLLITPFIAKAWSSPNNNERILTIFDFGAKGNGDHDDTEAFKKYLAKFKKLDLPAGKTFKIGEVSLNGKTVRGPGKIKIKVGSDCAFLLEGDNNRIENVEFISSGKGTRPESEILLGKELDYAVITGCLFNGNLFNAIGSNMNDVKDDTYAHASWRSKILISECKFNGNYTHHLYFHRVAELIVNSNFFEKSQLDSIRLRQWVKTANIVNNIFKDIGTSKSTDSKDGIDCYWSGLMLNIQGNQLEGIATHGFDVKGHSPDHDYGTSKVIISGNQIRKVGFSGILISSGDKTKSGWKAIRNVTIAQNHFEGCGYNTKNPNDAAIFLRHNQEEINIDGNQIYQNHHKGIMLGNFAPDAPNSKNILIRGNVITKNGSFGVHISGGNGVIVSDNILEKNAKGLVAEPYRNFKLESYKAQNNLVS